MKQLKAIALDVDVVLTDGGFWWGPYDEEWKRFCFADVMGVSRARKADLIIALMSGEDSPLSTGSPTNWASRTCTRTARTEPAPCAHSGTAFTSLSEIAFMGDDVNDVEAMQACGHAAAPADGFPPVREKAAFVSSRPGGHGAVREFVESILATMTAG